MMSNFPIVAGPNITLARVPPPFPNLFGIEQRPITAGMILFSLLHTAAMGALTYHGYKRNDSVGWGLMWGIPGSLVWPLTLAIAIGQGFGKPKK